MFFLGYAVRSALRGASAPRATRKPAVKRPAGMMGIGEAMTPEGRAEFARVWKLRRVKWEEYGDE